MSYYSRSIVVLCCISAVAHAAPVVDKADSDMKAVLDQLAVLQPKPMVSLPPTKARAQPDERLIRADTTGCMTGICMSK